MRSIQRIIILILIGIGLCSSPTQTKGRDQSIKPWTFLVYMARDNDLADFGTHNIEQMMAAANPHVNILVYDCHKLNGKKVAQKLLITENDVIVLGTTPNVDSGLEETFCNACLWALQEFPSDKFAVVAWNHGSGMLNRLPQAHHYMLRGFCYDDTTGNYLDDVKLMRALEKIVKFRKGKKIDIFGFDACLMADIEMIAALAPYALYTVASQETIPGEGWDYTGLLNWPQNTVLTAAEFAKQIVTSYDAYYRTRPYSYTLSAINNANFNHLNTAINELSQQLVFLLHSKYGSTLRRGIEKARNSFFEEPTYMDFYSFCYNLYGFINRLSFMDKPTATAIKTVLNKCTMLLRSMVTANVKSRDRSRASGLSIYFPQMYMIEDSYLNIFFGKTSKWVDFISDYVSPFSFF